MKRYLCAFVCSASIFVGACDRSTDTAASEVTPLIQSLAIARLPAQPVVADPELAKFGRQIFFDPGFSANGQFSCASCHRPELAFTDGLARSQGLGVAMRNAPTLLGLAHADWFYWDGRKDSLWSQALLPFEAPDEMGSDRVAVLQHVANSPEYRQQYERHFGALPSLPTTDDERVGPYAGAAARARWEALSTPQRRAISAAFANIGRAIAAYEAGLEMPSSPFDAYVAGDIDALTPLEKTGLKLFIDDERTRCLRCHNGPLLTNQGFHNIGTGSFRGIDRDHGRVFGLRFALMDEFNCRGPFASPSDPCEGLTYLSRDAHTPLEGAFKVPTLRQLTSTAPYFHDGRAKTLEAVIEHYRHPPSEGQESRHELTPIVITEAEKAALVAFLKALSAPPSPALSTAN